MAHTPSPWQASERGDYSDFDGKSRVILGGAKRSYNQRRIAVVQHSGTKEDEDNTRLIEAAPKLLEACRQAKKYLEPALTEPGRTVFWNLVAAINKATKPA